MPGKTERTKGWGRVFHEKFVVEERFMEPRARKALYVTSAVLAAAGLTAFLITLAGVLQHGGLALDDAVAERALLGMRSEQLTLVMIVVAVIFGPIALPIIVLVFTLLWGLLAKHAWRPMLLAAAVLTGVALAQIIGRSVERQRPPVSQMLFGVDTTFSFPSGHVLGASDFLLVTTFLVFSRYRNPRAAVVSFAVAIAGVLLAAVSRIYLGYHWFTDAVASMSLSLVVLGAVIAVDTWRTARIPGEEVTKKDYGIAK
ncbi:undecaprenyl-diphosphatase [Paenarthrobacter nicotinovorans]|uniref:phosphatase PAP2 family protein n=1 Tax=Paenarthrobacter nicotinovorans TaxID=29320 RepID=UPI00277F3D5B|nr:phosphatase PAP2 family protein [Paenarthrobacter nicotinovorans]MDP9933981.1 undecaprenyl-diphosphatase [Paenarthrobacter nicotinovorans]